MAFRGNTIEIAAQALQKAAIPYLHTVAYLGGACAERGRDDDWKVIRREEGGNLWALGGERDRFLFTPIMFSKVDVKSGPLTPTGEMKNDYAISQNARNDGERDQLVKVDYQRGETIHLESEETDTLGISNTSFIEGQVGGGETSGGSYVKAGTSITISGEMARRVQESKENTQLITLGTEVTLPPHSSGHIQQLIQTGPCRVKIVRKNVLDLGWKYVDWKHSRKSGFLTHHKWTGWEGTRSRVLWTVEDIADWELMIAGGHPKYPINADLIASAGFRAAIDYLADEDNRTIKVTSTAIFEKSIYGDLSFTPG